MGIHFGTGGWRAEIGKDFIMDNIRLVGQGVANMIREDGAQDQPVIIGYDRRFLSDTAAKWLAEVLAGNGIRVWFMKRSAPTPMVMHTVKKNDLYCGLEVTASHNPASYNGIKLIVKEGRDAPVETTRRLEEIIAGLKTEDIRSIPFLEGHESGIITHLHNPFNAFIDDIIDRLDMQAIRERGLRIAFDPMHGSGTFPLLVILYTARCTIDMIHDNKDAYFGSSLPAPTEETLHDLAEKVKMGRYDLGIAFDGDGDRIGIIDENGAYVSANEILSMLYWYLCEYKGWKGPVVRNYSTTHVLDRIAADFGQTCYEVPVGFKYISSKIDETDAVLGGESSGGLTVRGHIFGKDSIYASSLFVEMLSVTGMTTGEIRELIHKKYGQTAFTDCQIAFTQSDKEAISRVIMEEHRLPDGLDQISPIDHAAYPDGCKVYFKDDSFVTCRFSGTEPLLRIMAEAKDMETAKAYIAAFRALIDSIKNA